MNSKTTLRSGVLIAALLGSLALSACAPLLVGGAVGGALMASDRRTSGTQVEDQAIELKASNRVRDLLGERGHVNVTSYNRTVLITGEVPSDADRGAVEQTISRVENVRSTVNELAAAGNSSLTARSSDAIITGKVKATFVDAKDVQANAFKVVTERGVVYLMGRVTEREAKRAAELASGVGGVQKVVRVFEILTEQELADLTPKAPSKEPAKQQ
jgi:osmotically-inducible protein OsmY